MPHLILSWVEARQAGVKRYYTGVPCKRGHDSERYVSTRGCVACLRAEPTVGAPTVERQAEIAKRIAERNAAAVFKTRVAEGEIILRMLPTAGGATKDSYFAAGWKPADLVAAGLAEWFDTVSPVTVPPGATE